MVKNDLVHLIGDHHYLELISYFPNFEYREYQHLSVKRLGSYLSKNQNCLFLLDPGLGKTLISQLTYLLLRKNYSPVFKKVLVLVPGRLLRDQHYTALNWLNRSIQVLNLDATKTGNPYLTRGYFSRSDIIISTPKRLYNCLNNDFLLRKILKSVGLCIVDEFDAQSSEDIDEFGEPLGRISDSAIDLVNELKRNNTVFLCMSATKRMASQSWLDFLNLKIVKLPNKSIEDYRAYCDIFPIQIKDKYAVKCDNILQLISITCLRHVRKAIDNVYYLDPEIDPKLLLNQAKDVLANKRNYIYFNSPFDRRVYIKPGDFLFNVLGTYLKAQIHRINLYEGRLSEIEYETYSLKVNDNITYQDDLVVEAIKNIQYKTSPYENRKLNSILDIIKKNGAPGIILTRNIDTNTFIHNYLKNKNIRCASLTGDMSDSLRRINIRLFKEATIDILVLNRKLGGRGFDLPHANYCIFLSPKRSEETMWQEMLRIRSSKHNIKSVYILAFQGTSDMNKLQDLIRAMDNKPKCYNLNSLVTQ